MELYSDIQCSENTNIIYSLVYIGVCCKFEECRRHHTAALLTLNGFIKIPLCCFIPVLTSAVIYFIFFALNYERAVETPPLCSCDLAIPPVNIVFASVGGAEWGVHWRINVLTFILTYIPFVPVHNHGSYNSLRLPYVTS